MNYPAHLTIAGRRIVRQSYLKAFTVLMIALAARNAFELLSW
jgi:hypothetical protein